MVYPGKRDWWIAGLFTLIAAPMLVGGGTLMGMALIGGPTGMLFPGTVLTLVGGMLLWILFGTSYEITETSLIIRCGPIRCRIALDAIEDVIPSGFLGGPPIEYNFGLAIQGLRVRYRKKNGGVTWPFRIAPRDRAGFLLELSERQPGLEVKDDGSLRRPTEPGIS
jgi:hypothetical protein